MLNLLSKIERLPTSLNKPATRGDHVDKQTLTVKSICITEDHSLFMYKRTSNARFIMNIH